MNHFATTQLYLVPNTQASLIHQQIDRCHQHQRQLHFRAQLDSIEQQQTPADGGVVVAADTMSYIVQQVLLW